jgi:hypothetical protein
MKKVLIIVVMLILAGAAGLQYADKDVYIWERDRANQEHIGDAYVAFCKEQKKFPTSLADLVSKGYLPAKAYFYREPPGFFQLDCSFEKSTYQVFAPPSGDVRNLAMIARKKSDGTWQFDSDGSAYIRDKILDFDFIRDHNRDPDYIRSKVIPGYQPNSGTQSQPATQH